MEQSLTPTPELLRRYESYQKPQKNQTKNNNAYKLNSVLDSLRDAGDITEDEFIAALRLYKHFVRSLPSGALISGYGERLGGSTPLAQMAGNEGLLPEERRAHHSRQKEACLEVLGAFRDAYAMFTFVVLMEQKLHQAATQIWSGERKTVTARGKQALVFACQVIKQHFDGKYRTTGNPP